MSADEDTTVHGPRFAVVPETVIYAKVTPSAKVLWMVLARHADPDGQCFPGRRRLAELLGCNEDSVTRLKQELLTAALIALHPEYDGDRRIRDRIELLGWREISRPSARKNAPNGAKNRGGVGAKNREARTKAIENENYRVRENESTPKPAGPKPDCSVCEGRGEYQAQRADPTSSTPTLYWVACSQCLGARQ